MNHYKSNCFIEGFQWEKVKNDFEQCAVGFENIDALDEKVDDIRHCYTALKCRIVNEYCQEELAEEMNMLNRVYSQAKEEMADGYANHIGAFYEYLGHRGIAEDMKNSLLAIIDNIALEYKNISQMNSLQSSYTLEELTAAGLFAKGLHEQLHAAAKTWHFVDIDDRELGIRLAKQYDVTLTAIKDLCMGKNIEKLINKTFEPFIEKLIECMNAKIYAQSQELKRNGWIAELLRTKPIDKDVVFEAYLMAKMQ